MTVTLILFVVTGVEHARDKNVPGFLFFGIGIVVLVWGAYLAWNEEHSKLLAERAKNSMPRFSITGSRLVRLIRSKDEVSHPVLLVYVSVVNLVASTSTLRTIRLQLPVESEETEPINFRTAYITVDVPEERYIGGEKVTHISESSELITNLMPSAKGDGLVRGHHVEGWLLFSGVDKDHLYRDAVSFQLVAVDAYGNQHCSQILKCAMESAQQRSGL